ncbi:MAG: hypothetical protein R3208_13140, partial [Ketobacteraceae bacterium]|nr:hypothetical protein [Ketobacteraceae bacterium]
PIKRLMKEASEDLSALIPLAYDDEAFRKEANRQRIRNYLQDLESLFSQKAARLGDRSDTAWISLKVLQDHLTETSKLFGAGYFAMSQYLLTSTPAICATCHLQDSAHGSFESQLSRDQFANDYSYAEYLFTIRQYDKAEDFYESHLKHQEVKDSRFQYLKPLERLMTIELGISGSVENTRQLLKQHKANTEQVEIKQVISEWQTGLGEIKAAGAKNNVELTRLFDRWFTLSPGTSHEFILDEKRRPQAIWLRSQLFASLQQEQSRADVASTLYMLAVIDRLLGQNEPYSFANLYLKQCVIRYPETPSAERCLQEYRNHLSFYYGGSAGEAIPEELIKEYTAMKAVLDKVR